VEQIQRASENVYEYPYRVTQADLLAQLNLLGNPRRVLVVEDKLSWLAKLTEFLTEAGHEVVSVSGITHVEGDIVTSPGYNPETVVTFRLSEIHVAFLDHYFLSNNYNGANFTELLHRNTTAKIVGMSSDPGANLAMKKAGAHWVFRKAELERMF
jgi:hypothetical protein